MLKKALRDTLHCALELLMLSLVLVIVLQGNLPEGTPGWAAYLYVAFLFIYCFAGPFLWLLCGGRLRSVQLIVGLALCAAGIYLPHIFLPFDAARLAYYLVTIVGVFIRGYYIADKPWEEIAPSTVYTFLMLVNLLFMVVIGIVPTLAHYKLAVTLFGPVVAIASLLTMNSVNMQGLISVQRDADRVGKMAISRSMRKINRIMTLVTFCVALLFSGFGFLTKYIFRFFTSLYGKLVASMDTEPTGQMGSMDAPMMDDLKQELTRSHMGAGATKAVQIIMYVLAAVVLVGLLILVLYILRLLVKKLVELYRAMIESRGQSDLDVDEYTDKTEHLEAADILGGYRDKLRDAMDRLKGEPAWNRLHTAEEKVRSLYRRAVYQAMGKGWKFDSSRTARQTMQQLEKRDEKNAAALRTLGEYYDRVRYGGNAPSEAEADRLHEQL